MKEKIVDFKSIMLSCKVIVKKLKKDNYKPDVIIAISRGGTVIGKVAEVLRTIIEGQCKDVFEYSIFGDSTGQTSIGDFSA